MLDPYAEAETDLRRRQLEAAELIPLTARASEITWSVQPGARRHTRWYCA